MLPCPGCFRSIAISTAPLPPATPSFFSRSNSGQVPSSDEEILDLIVEGKITVFEAIRRELGTVKVSWEEAVDPAAGADLVGPGLWDVCPVVQRYGKPFDDRQFGDGTGGTPLPGAVRPTDLRPLGDPSADGWQYTERPENDKRMLLAGESQSKCGLHRGWDLRCGSHSVRESPVREVRSFPGIPLQEERNSPSDIH